MEPIEGYLPARESLNVQVTLVLVDRGTYASSLEVVVQHGRTMVIAVSASGIGCGIFFDPAIFPELNLGYLFR